MKKVDEKVEELPLEEEEEESVLKKIMVGTIALFLIFLVVSLALASPNIQNIIISLLVSDVIEEGLVEQDVTVQFEEKVYEELVAMYQDNQAHEFKVCLKGTYDTVYFIDELIVPETFSQSYNQVISEACPKYTLIALHTHPYRHCIASGQDLKNLENAKKANPDALIGIMCEPGRFNFYS